MPNTSATGGHLTPTTPAPATDTDLEDILQAVVVGITGLPGRMVRPRWQRVPPRQPEVDEDWCAIGIERTTPDGQTARIHDGTGDGSTTSRQHLTLDVLASFYGPCAEGYAGLLADGLYIAQNREGLLRAGMALIDVAPAVNASDLQNTFWRRRIDLPFRLRRRIDRTYPILNIVKVHGTIVAQGGSADGEVITQTPFTAPPEN